MPPFDICASEALLLGYSVGSYSGGSVFQKFVAHLRETVSHFVEDFGFLSLAGNTAVVRDGKETTLWDLKEAELDELFIFVDVDEDYRVGASIQIPDVLVEKPRSSSCVRGLLWPRQFVTSSPVFTQLSDTRRSLVDLVVIHFGEFLDLSPGQHLLRHLALTGEFPEGWSGIIQRFFTQKSAEAGWRSVIGRNEEQIDKFSETIQQLSNDNACGEAYLAGKLFGEACLKTADEERKYWLFDEEAAMETEISITDEPFCTDAPVNWEEEVFYSGPNSHLDQLLRLQVVRSSHLCSGVLSSIRRKSLEVTYEVALDWLANELLDISMIHESRRVQQALAWAFGALYRELWGLEAIHRDRALDKAAPRSLAEVCLDHPDEIRAQLKRIWRMLDVPDFEPEDVIRSMCNAVEVLIIKRTWPKTESVPKAIHEMLESGTELEKRLAAIARPLHYEYRNTAAHGERTNYSFNEATYFLAGVRAMVDLVERIEDQRRGHEPQDSTQ